MKHLSTDTSNTTKPGCSHVPSAPPGRHHSARTEGRSKEWLCLEEPLLTLRPREELAPLAPSLLGTALPCPASEGTEVEGAGHGAAMLTVMLPW